jgi:hypothetical protein
MSQLSALCLLSCIYIITNSGPMDKIHTQELRPYPFVPTRSGHLTWHLRPCTLMLNKTPPTKVVLFISWGYSLGLHSHSQLSGVALID